MILLGCRLRHTRAEFHSLTSYLQRRQAVKGESAPTVWTAGEANDFVPQNKMT